MEMLNSMSQIDEMVIAEFANLPNGLSYLEKTTKLLDKYKDILRQFSLRDDNSISIYDEEDLKIVVDKYLKDIKKLIESYSRGKLIEGNRITNRLFGITANRSTAEAYFPKIKIPKNCFWFRSRTPELDKVMGRKDLFHVPFEKRSKVGANRYSIPGYPCLYLASTMEYAREETGNKPISAISCFKNDIDIEVYDFSFYSKAEMSRKYLFNAIKSYPFKIVSSIPVNSSDESFKYMEEFIIPQLILHCAIKQRGISPKVYGLIYSSTKAIQQSLPSEAFSKHLNLVIPTFFVPNVGHCRFLKLHFPMTKPEIVPFGYLKDNQLNQIEEEMKYKKFICLK